MALMVTPPSFSVFPSTLICLLTTKVIPGAKVLRVHLAKNEAGLKEKSDVLMDQVRAIDNQRFKQKLGVLSKQNRLNLLRSLRAILDL